MGASDAFPLWMLWESVKENVVKHRIESARVSYTFKSAAASEDEPAGSTSGHRENLGGERGRLIVTSIRA